ncbi:MAG: CBS domain-containing protein [Pseudomonadota bacterium]
MKTFTVKELMVPLPEYATVSEDATLFDAVMALEKAQEAFNDTKYVHRAILILDKNRRVVGKISQLDALRALEPKYDKILDGPGLNRYGFSQPFMKSLLKDYHLWNAPLREICKRAASIKIKKFMYTPGEGEFIDETANLDEAIHQLVIGSHQSLLVMKDTEITGILRLTDVFAAVFAVMHECHLDEI